MADIGLTLEIMNTPTKVIPTSATIVSTEYKHDVAEIVVRRPLLNEFTPYISGAPVKLTWKSSSRGRSGTFYGYFDRVDPPFTRTGGSIAQSLATLRCYGTSYITKEEGFSTFVGLTADQIVTEVARSFNFSFVTDPHTYQWPTYSQGGKSYWAFLVGLAHRIGYTLYVLGTTLYFVDRRTAGGLVRTPYAYILNKTTTGPTDVLAFRPKISSGDGVDIKKAGSYVVRGISDSSGDLFEVTQESTPRYGSTLIQQKLFTRTITGQAPTSVGEAQTYANAAEALSLFTMEATMTVRGNAGLAPGGLVSLATPDARHRQFVGTWYVKEVTQLLNPASYTTMVNIATDAAGTAGVTPTYGTLNQNSLPPTVLANNGLWQSRWAQ